MNMNPVLANPDIKINMSLDEIIHFTREEINNQLNRKNLRGFKKKNRNFKSKAEMYGSYHSVPLMGTKTGVDIYVSNHSPLLSAENKRRFAQAFSNRAINSELLQKSKEIIPAEYKLVKTTHGVERILVPAVNHIRPLNKKLTRPRKLKKIMEKPANVAHDKPPPLIGAPIYNPNSDLKMEVDDSDDEIVVLDILDKKNQVIDITTDKGDDVLQAKTLWVPPDSSMHCMSTLNDRFTMLHGTFQF